MIKREGGIKMKQYKTKYDTDLTENIWADIFDENKKELYFMVNFDIPVTNSNRFVRGNYRFDDTKIIVKLMRKALDKYDKLDANEIEKNSDSMFDFDFEDRTGHQITLDGGIHDIDSKWCKSFCKTYGVKKCDHSRCRIMGDIDFGVNPSKIRMMIPTYEAEELYDQLYKNIKHAEIENMNDNDMIPDERVIDVSRIQLLSSLSEVESLIELIERIEKEIPKENIILEGSNGWQLNIQAECDCIECNKNKVETKVILHNVKNSIDVTFYVDEIRELLWALRRLIQKNHPKIAKLVRMRVAKTWK